jgi:hypothetical protein
MPILLSLHPYPSYTPPSTHLKCPCLNSMYIPCMSTLCCHSVLVIRKIHSAKPSIYTSKSDVTIHTSSTFFGWTPNPILEQVESRALHHRVPSKKELSSLFLLCYGYFNYNLESYLELTSITRPLPITMRKFHITASATILAAVLTYSALSNNSQIGCTYKHQQLGSLLRSPCQDAFRSKTRMPRSPTQYLRCLLTAFLYPLTLCQQLLAFEKQYPNWTMLPGRLSSHHSELALDLGGCGENQRIAPE